jgi:hypothetical protein
MLRPELLPTAPVKSRLLPLHGGEIVVHHLPLSPRRDRMRCVIRPHPVRNITTPYRCGYEYGTFRRNFLFPRTCSVSCQLMLCGA